MTKIITFPVNKRVQPSNPIGPNRPVGGVAVIRRTIFTQAIGQRAA